MNWEQIRDADRNEFERYKEYQRMLRATYGVGSPEEYRRKYNKEPPHG